MEDKRKLQKAKRVLEYTIIVCVILSIFVDYAFLFRMSAKKSYQERLTEAGEQIATGVRQNMEQAVILVEVMAEVMSRYEDIHCEEAIDCMERVSQHTNFTRMWLTKANGEALSSEGNTSDATGREYLADGLKGNSGISAVQHSRVNGEKNVVVYAPIYHNETITGLMIGIYRLDLLAEVVDIDCFGQNGYCKLIKEDGTVLVEAEDSSAVAAGSYSYTCSAGVNDWNVFIQLPEEFVSEDAGMMVASSAVACAKLTIIALYVLFSRYKVKKGILQKLAQTDSMTLLWNRGTIEEKITEYMERDGDKKHAFVILDIDRFKVINDTIGHMAGDVLIKELAVQLLEVFGEKGLVSRLGGDEFAVFIPEINSIEDIKEQIGNLFGKIKGIAAEHNWENKVTVSIGLAISPADGRDFESLYRAADRKLYEAKANGGNQVIY